MAEFGDDNGDRVPLHKAAKVPLPIADTGIDSNAVRELDHVNGCFEERATLGFGHVARGYCAEWKVDGDLSFDLR